MNDIFVSYASADRARARQVAEAMTARGWKVWWDRTIPPGREFDEVIEEALDASQCVVVLWSNASVASTWVKTEAAEAMRRKILIPALIDAVKIPLEFRRLQAADLSTWHGEPEHEELQKFFQSIEANVRHAGPGPVQPAPAKPGPPHVEHAPEPAPPRAELARALPPVTRAETPAPRARSTGLILAIAGVVALVVGVAGYLAYNEHAKRVALEEKAAQDRRAAEEARSAAEEATARARAAQAEAERHAAQRKLEEQRRAAEDAARATRERAAREKVEQERLARERSERERLAREKAERERTESLAREERQKKSAKGLSSMKLAWKDNALRFNGVLTVGAGAGTLRAAAWDLRSGEGIGNYDVPVTIVRQGPTDFVVLGSFAVPGDSVTPGPHTHTSRLHFRQEPDGTFRFIQNCPQPANCYPAQ